MPEWLKTQHIIVEGENGVGKTTIIKALKKLIPSLHYYHFMFPKGSTDLEKYHYQKGQFNLMFDLLRASSNNWIFDRSHIGEYVYGPIHRNMSPKYMPKLESDNSDLSIVIINVICDPKIVRKRFEDTRPNEKIPTIKLLENNQKAFQLSINKSPFKSITIDTTNIQTKEINNILNKLTRQDFK